MALLGPFVAASFFILQPRHFCVCGLSDKEHGIKFATGRTEVCKIKHRSERKGAVYFAGQEHVLIAIGVYLIVILPVNSFIEVMQMYNDTKLLNNKQENPLSHINKRIK